MGYNQIPNQKHGRERERVKQRGFTLIELMVVIFIIALLATIIGISVHNVKVKARNTKRKAEIKQLINAFNMAYENDWPANNSETGWACVSTSCEGADGVTIEQDEAIISTLSQYLSSIPTDPPANRDGAFGYFYNSWWSGGSSGDYNCSPDITFMPGTYLQWILEPASSADCSPGLPWSCQPSVYPDMIACMYKFE